MKDVNEVIRQKDLAIIKVKREILALNISAPLLAEESDRNAAAQSEKEMLEGA